MKRRYRTDLDIHDVRCFLESYGFIERKRDSGSSHIIFGHATGIIVCVAALSGRITLRLTKSLHHSIIRRA